MNKMIKVSPGLARIIKSFGKSRTSLPSANGTKIVIRNPELLRIIRAFGKASKQVKSSPLSLRSADNANYSEVQALKDRIAKLTAEKEYLKDQYDQQKEQGKAFYDNLLAQHNNLNIAYRNLQNQNGVLQNQNGALTNQVTNLQNQVTLSDQRIQRIKNHVNNFRNDRNNFFGKKVNDHVKRTQAVALFNFIASA